MNDIDNEVMIEIQEHHLHEEAENREEEGDISNREEECDVSPEREAPIWSFDCLVICTCLGLGLSNKEIKKLCHKYELISKDQAVDPGYGFFRLHHASHKKSHLTKKLTKMFNQRYHLTIEQVRRMPTEDEQEWNSLVQESMEGHPMPVLWALLTDPRPDINHYGVYLAHHATMNSLQAVGRRRGEDREAAKSTPASSRLKTEYRRLRERVARTLWENKRLAKQVAESRSANEKLVKQADRLISRIAELEARPTREARLERELRKTRYELEKVGSSNDEPAAETDDPADPAPEPEEIRFAFNDTAACPGISSLSLPAPDDCPLEGLKVAIVGGLDRMELQYARIVESLGATFIFHDGRCRNGTYTLRNMVCQADIVVFITSCNSHPALKAVKATCRKTGKSFYVLKQTGADSLKKILLQVAS